MKDSNKTKFMALKSNNVISIHASPEVDFDLELTALLPDEKSNPHNEKDFVFYNKLPDGGMVELFSLCRMENGLEIKTKKPKKEVDC